ncbi:hypothetical protein [Streptomyces sp. NPDC007088]|uniref:hypothetical protein n=1 Tax=Streptomyces sp. NPDC007088 TaxID=3364773 RepID=UPI00367AF938
MRRRTAATVCALGLLLAGCGGAAKGEAPRDQGAAVALRAARTATALAGSATVDSVTEADGVRSLAHGSLDWSRPGAPRGRLRVRAPGAGGPAEFRVRPEAYWVRLAEPVGGRHWARYPRRAAEALAPQSSVDLLLSAADAHRAGRARIRGVVATHYAGVVHASESARVRAAGVKRQSVDLWVDGRGRLVKRVESGRGDGGLIRTTTYWTEFGTTVPAVPEPPAGDRISAAELSH